MGEMTAPNGLHMADVMDKYVFRAGITDGKAR